MVSILKQWQTQKNERTSDQVPWQFFAPRSKSALSRCRPLVAQKYGNKPDIEIHCPEAAMLIEILPFLERSGSAPKPTQNFWSGIQYECDSDDH